jgi:hypothetical protein
MEPVFPFMGAIGSILVLTAVLYAAIKLVSGGQPINSVGIFMQIAFGMLLIFPKQVLTGVFNLTSWLSSFLYGASEETSQAQPEPEPVNSTPSGSVDLSWVPGALVVTGIVATAIAAGLGLFHYYRKSLRPSLMKARSEAQSAAKLVAEARKTLEWVVLDSASYEMDLAKQIDYPMMTDVTEPTVGKYVREMRQAQEKERALATKPLLADAERFSNTVTCLKISYEAAVRKAERVRWSSFSVAEQRRLKDARIALDVIQDSSTTAEQRNAQYKRISKLLDGLIVLTEPVRQSLSAWVPMLALGAGSTAPAVVSEEKVLVQAR